MSCCFEEKEWKKTRLLSWSTQNRSTKGSNHALSLLEFCYQQSFGFMAHNAQQLGLVSSFRRKSRNQTIDIHKELYHRYLFTRCTGKRSMHHQSAINHTILQINRKKTRQKTKTLFIIPFLPNYIMLSQLCSFPSSPPQTHHREPRPSLHHHLYSQHQQAVPALHRSPHPQPVK